MSKKIIMNDINNALIIAELENLEDFIKEMDEDNEENPSILSEPSEYFTRYNETLDRIQEIKIYLQEHIIKE